MSQHRILRQVIELDGCPPGTDAALRAQLGALVQRHLQPVIERACEALDAPGRLWRAERLTLDLGHLPLADDLQRPADEDWGRRLAERLEAGLAPALADALQATDPRQADLELLAQFIATGTVPWWADLGDRLLVTAALRRVLDDGPALASLGLGRVGAAWPRLVASAGESEAMRWLDMLLPDAGGPALWRAWRDALADAAEAAGGAAPALHPLWWALALPAAVRARIDGQGLDAAALAQALAAALGLAPQRLWPAWRRAFDQRLSSAGAGAGGERWWHALQDAPAAPAGGNTASGSGAGEAALDWLRRQAALQAEGSLMRGLLAALASAWPHLPSPARHAAAARWLAPDSPAAGALAHGAPVLPPALDSLSAPGWQALAALLHAAGQAGRLPVALADALHAAAVAPQSSRAPAELAALAARYAALGPAAVPRGDADEAAAVIDPQFANTDRITVADAGLVLLWPFLPAFFTRLGWLAEDSEPAGMPATAARPGRAFASPALAARAALLLHSLASGDSTAPLAGGPVAEHLLPLAKLLCGLAPEAPLASWAPPAAAASPADPDGAEDWAAAQAEGDLLMQAAIAQAPILRAMSVPAFRASFLQRAGQLGVRDDHWLLRVERTSYDMVRDRFPWAVSVLRLPWMNATLQVEW